MAFRNQLTRLSQLVADSITGAIISTAASGARWVIQNGTGTLPNTIQGFTGGASETVPAFLETAYGGATATKCDLILSSAQTAGNANVATLELSNDGTNSSTAVIAALTAEFIDLNGFNDVEIQSNAQVSIDAPQVFANNLDVAHAEYVIPQQQTVANSSTPNGVATLFRWTTPVQTDSTNTIQNPNSALNGDGRIVFATAGLYRITCNFTFGSNGAGQRSLSLLLNAGATVIGYDSNDGTSGLGTQLSIVLEKRFAAGDYFTTSLFQNSGTNPLGVLSGGEGYNHLHISRVGV